MPTRTTTAVLCLAYGGLGVHHYYLGNLEKFKKSLILALVTCGVFFVLNTIEAIKLGTKLLDMSDADFVKFYDEYKKDGGSASASPADSSKTQNSADTSNIEQLKNYKQLLDNGTITQEEFNALKAKLLGE